MKLDPKAIELILQFEIGGSKKYYDKFLARPSWPGGASGVTIGIGYDLGYDKNFEKEWEGKLSKDAITRLKRLKGMTGARASSSISGVRDIIVPWDAAMEVFEEFTLPEYIEQTIDAFPNSQYLPPPAFGALVSLVFNRGPLVDKSDRRKEMRAIREILLAGNDTEHDIVDIGQIASQVRKMSRLWPDNTKSDNDLHDRRHAEADLILSALD